MSVVEVPEKKRSRGRETATDMVRSLGLVLAGVVAVFYFAQPPASDSARIRPVEPAGDVSAFRADVPGAPVPAALPAGWTSTVSALTGAPRALRIGYNTPTGTYAEFAASTGPSAQLVQDLTGRGRSLGPVDVAGAPWERYVDADGSLSLVRAYGPVTVVVGTLRATAPESELAVLARSLTVG